MIHPVPAGVNPNTHRCGCGGMLRMPWVHELQDHALVCTVDADHDTYQKKPYNTRHLYDGATGELKEYDITTQRPTSELAPITDQATALATVNRASDLGLFPDKATPEQAQLLAQVAFAYGVDPLMGEIIPYQGRPYITIAGRRRLDNVAGHRVSVAFRPPTGDEEAYYIKVGAMQETDVVQICVGTDTESGMTVEGFGRVLGSEGSGASRNAQAFLPVVQRKIEMAQKRGERRMREIMFGPVAKPDLVRNITILEEGDETNVVEGASHIVDDADPFNQGHLGDCPEHQVPWSMDDHYGTIRAFHKANDVPWCTFGKVYAPIFASSYAASHDGEFVKKDADAWLKETFNGLTWSKMAPRQQLDAIGHWDARTGTPPNVDEETGEIPDPAEDGPQKYSGETPRPSNQELDQEAEREQAAAEH